MTTTQKAQTGKATNDGKGLKPSEQVHKVDANALVKPGDAPPASKALALTFDAADELAADFEGGEVISGGFEGVMWVPQLIQFRDEVVEAKMAKLGLSYSTRSMVGGRLEQKMCWGDMRYVLDMPAKGGGTIRALLPSHIALYALLGSVKLGATVAIMFDGFGTAKPNQNAPARYKIKVKEKADVLTMKRHDALVPTKKEDDDAPTIEGERL